MIEPKIFSVTQVNRYIKGVLENDFILNSLWIKGEISNFKAHSNGHFYFTIKDKTSAINCVMFKGASILLPFLPENGMSVIMCGYVTHYEKSGQIQFYAELMEPVGIGALNLSYEQLKKRLSEEGLFDECYKREISQYPCRVAIITSPTGAAVRDIIKIIKRRNKSVKIIIIPVLVQGENSRSSIISAIKLANEFTKADTIILGRGGGSIEDLWSFNDEGVARAIFASEIPVISAVGHETDFTIVDFISDLRASTPSAAAELATADSNSIYRRIIELRERIIAKTNMISKNGQDQLNRLILRPVMRHPLMPIHNFEIELESKCRQMQKELERKIQKQKLNHSFLLRRLESASPLTVLNRGYAIVSKANSEVLSSVLNIKENDVLKIQLKDGIIESTVLRRV